MIRSIAPLCVAVACAALSQPAHAEGEKELAAAQKLEYTVVREDGKVVAVPYTGLPFNRPLSLWDPVTDKRTKLLPKGLPEENIYPMPSADGKTFLVRLRSEKGEYTILRLFDVETGKELGSAKGEGNIHPHPSCTAISPDGTRVVCKRSNKSDGMLLLLDMKTGKAEEIATNALRVEQPIFSADGKYLAAATGKRPNASDLTHGITVWETTTWKVTHDFRADTDDVGLFGISPDVKNLVAIGEPITGKEWNLRMWSLETGKPIWNLARTQKPKQKVHPFGGLAFGKKGEIVAVGTPGAVLILDAATGKEIGSVKLPTGEELGNPWQPELLTPSSLSMSSDGKLLAVTFDYGLATKVYDISKLKK